MPAQKKEVTKRDFAEKFTNPKDLSDERKAQILSEEFVKFQESMKEMLGMQIGVRLQKIESETSFGHQAIMVPVKLQPVKEETKKVETNEQETKA